MRTILIHGASSAAGWYDMERGGWANRLSKNALDVNLANPQEAVMIQNHSIPGNTLPGILKDIDRVDTYRRLGSVTAILAIGLNEAKIMNGATRPLVTPSRFQGFLSDYSKAMRERSVNVVYLGTEVLTKETIVTENGNTFEDDLVAEYDALIDERAQEDDMPYISLARLFKASGFEASVATDGYHPSAIGHAAIHAAISQELTKLGVFRVNPETALLDITTQLVADRES